MRTTHACALLALPLVAGAAGPPNPAPEIGLVLGGGGARGGAHIGVMRVLEELRVPVHHVAGTSMGSIIGGFYSIGYSPDEIASIAQGIDWDSVFEDAPQRRRLSFRRKEDDDLPLWPIEIGVGGRGQPSGPSGLTTASRMEFIFRSRTLDVAGVHDFDALPIPYRAVAADLDTGDPVVLDHGELALAMRASMSIPVVFTPVELDGRLLVDGGIAMNLPIEVAQDMGASVIIAVDVGTPPKGASKNLSALGVYSQTFAVLSQENVERSRERLGEGDVLIVPDLEGVRTGSFRDIGKAIVAGEAAARAVADRLRRYSVSEEDYARFLDRQRRDRRAHPAVVIDEVVVEGVTRISPEVVERRLRTAPGGTLDPDLLAHDLDRVSQAGEFQSVGFRLEEHEEQNRLVIEAREKTWGPGYLRLGLGFESDFEASTEFRLLANYRRAHINRLGAEWKTNVSVGDPFGFVTEFFQPLEPTGFWFVAPSVGAVQNREEAFIRNGTEREVVDERFALGGVDFGIQIRNYGEVRLGVFGGHYDADLETTTTASDAERNLGILRFQATVDQLDSVTFPTRGHLTRLDVETSQDSLGADDEYERLDLEVLHAGTWGHNTFLGSVRIGSDLGSDLPFYREFQLGGFLNLSGLEVGALQDDTKALFMLGDYWRLGRLGSFGKLYAGAILQAANVWPDFDDAEFNELIYSGTLFFGVDTRFSPIYLAYGFAEGGESAAYLFLGKPFGR